jgi:WD40 repeat protein
LLSATGELVADVVGADPPRGDPAHWAENPDLAAHIYGHEPGVDPGYRTVVNVGFRPDGTWLAVAAKNGAVWIWTIDGELVARFVTDLGSPDRTFDMACDPQGEFIATAVRDEVGLWDWKGHRVGRLPTSGYKVWQVWFAPDGEPILTMADNPGGPPPYVRELWARDGRRLGLMSWARTREEPFRAPVFDNHGRYILQSGKDDLPITDWDGGYLARLAAALGIELLDHARSPGGDLIAGLFDDGGVRIWSFPPVY